MLKPFSLPFFGFGRELPLFTLLKREQSPRSTSTTHVTIRKISWGSISPEQKIE